jgi:membrane-associated protein
MGIDIPKLVESLGYFGVWGIIFAESGLMIGFFLPGDSLLFTAGFLASLGHLNVFVLIFGSFVCAVLGDNVGYATGHRFGRKLFLRENSRFFKKEYLVKTQDFYDEHGKKALVLARFLPIIRTFAPIVAGVAAMKYTTFMVYNLIGGLLWTVGVTSLGVVLGKVIPEDKIDHYLLPIILCIIVLSLLPSVWHLIKDKQSKSD